MSQIPDRIGRNRALIDLANYCFVEKQYVISNCRGAFPGCGEVAEVYVFPWSDPTGIGRDICSYATQGGFRSVAVIDDCLPPFISSALEGRLATAVAKWGLSNLDDCCGPRTEGIAVGSV